MDYHTYIFYHGFLYNNIIIYINILHKDEENLIYLLYKFNLLYNRRYNNNSSNNYYNRGCIA